MPSRRVLIVEDDAFTAGLMAAALDRAGFSVRTATSAAEARRELDTFDPDAALLDLSLGSGPNGVDLAHIVHRRHPGVAMLLLTRHPDLRTAGFTEADLPPTCGFLRKESVTDAAQLVGAVERALADQVERMILDSTAGTPLAALTSTQLAVLRAVAQGFTTPKIAATRGTTTSAVEKVLGSIYEALDVDGDDGINRRAEAMRIYIEYVGLPDRA